MKPVRCSWVDMQKVRASLSNGKRGDQKALEQMRCVDHSTISRWKAACDVLGAVDGKCAISHISTFQPSHAQSLAREFRKMYGRDPDKWPQEELLGWIDHCEENAFTVEQFNAALKAARRIELPNDEPGCTADDLSKVTAKFGCIYADPPWQYGNQSTRASTDNHYSTMSLDEIAALPVPELAAEKCHLHLWTTESFLEDAIALLRGWGFERKSGFIWVKPQLGIGNYWRCSHEIMLLGVKGGLTFPPTNIKSWIEHDRTKHSSKPEAVRKLIEQVSPGPYLELFGRKAVHGWTVWGNEIERGIFDGMIAAL